MVRVQSYMNKIKVVIAVDELAIPDPHRRRSPYKVFLPSAENRYTLPSPVENRCLPSLAENRSTLPSPAENRCLPSSAENRYLPSPAENRYPFSPLPEKMASSSKRSWISNGSSSSRNENFLSKECENAYGRYSASKITPSRILIQSNIDFQILPL
ncbi:hypothetical protein M5K25_013451 [Dendrobium thyrsiflorum]|uniref:Uncharacterized protein n=1 Tax=Dendrobium thyrsiflorum TaxID=117978 RepID=A0ABD0USW9_DENTH